MHPSHTQVSLCPINIYKISTYTISRDWLQRRLRPQDSETARRFVCDVRSGQYTLHHHHHHYNYHHNHYHHHRPRRAGTAPGPSAATACQHGHTACEVNHISAVNIIIICNIYHLLTRRCHHLLKSHLFKQCPNTQLSPRQLQACFTSLAADEVTAALACPRNLYSPLVKV